jgi:glyoxalase family protein
MSILGLHHVTATVGDAQDDLNFALGSLGLRLVKKTVNFDNHHVYHFYYGDERGSPGTLWTTFPYKDRGVIVGTKGAGQVVATSFSAPAGSLPFWTKRLRERGAVAAESGDRFGDAAITFADASGLRFEIVESARDARTPWIAGGIRAGAAIRGLHSVTIAVREPAKTLALMTTLLGFAVVNETAGRIRVAVNGDAPGRIIDIAHGKDMAQAVNGLGTVHHVAMAIGNADEQLRLREELLAYGCKVTEVRDRCYFTSIYFREPGGVLFEVATVGPGFTVDEDLSELGSSLKLPPWTEPERAAIEAGLVDVETAL